MGTYLKINTCMNFQDEMNFRKIITWNKSFLLKDTPDQQYTPG
jgi:hypothetical protein